MERMGSPAVATWVFEEKRRTSMRTSSRLAPGSGVGISDGRSSGVRGSVGNADPALGSVDIVDPQPPSMGLRRGDAHDDALPLFHWADEG